MRFGGLGSLWFRAWRLWLDVQDNGGNAQVSRKQIDD